MSNYDLDLARKHFESRLAFTTGVHELDLLVQQHRDDVVVIDVRYPSDYANGHVPGAINLPKGKWHNTRQLRGDATHYLYCYTQTCHLAAEAAVELIRQGYKVVEVEGGWAAWQASNYPSQTTTQAA